MFKRTTGDQMNDVLRQLLESNGARFASVVFVKKDKSVRKMTYVNAKHRAHCMVGSERGAKAAATRRANNPQQACVYDHVSGGFRTVTLPRIMTLRVDGKTYRVRSYQEACNG